MKTEGLKELKNEMEIMTKICNLTFFSLCLKLFFFWTGPPARIAAIPPAIAERKEIEGRAREIQPLNS